MPLRIWIEINKGAITINIENVMACYCKARESQAFYMSCLTDKGLSDKEKDMLYELIQNASHASSIVKSYCELKARE